MFNVMCSTGLDGGAAAAPFLAIPIILFIMMMGLFVTAIFLFKLLLWWRIFSKAGYSGAFGLLLLAPFGAIIMLCILAFSAWPMAKKGIEAVK